MGVSQVYGSQIVPTRTWKPQIELSGPTIGQTPPEELRVDPFLGSVATDPFNMAGAIAIPIGRFVAIGNAQPVNSGTNAYRAAIGTVGKTPLTLADGYNLRSCGMSVNQMYKESNDFMTDMNTVKYRKEFLAELPYVLAIQNSNGTLYAGDRVTAYWGSTTSTSNISIQHRGKPVKWISKALYTSTYQATGASAFGVVQANQPGVAVRPVMAWSNANGLVAGTFTTSWVSSSWFINTPASANYVVFEYGQDADYISGECVRIQSLSDVLNRDNWLKWVEIGPKDWLNFPPAAQRLAVTTVAPSTANDPSTAETPTTVLSGYRYQVLHFPMSLHNPVIVWVSGTVTDLQGNVTTYSGAAGATNWFQCPVSNILDARTYFIGMFHTINWRTGIIEFSANLAITGVRVQYSYIVDYREGAVIWGVGVQGLTDGSFINPAQVGATALSPPNAYGVPAHLNLSDVVAAMRIQVW